MGSEITTCCFLQRPASLVHFINACYTFSLHQNNTRRPDGCLRHQNITLPCNLISCCSTFNLALLKNRTKRQPFHLSLLLKSRSVFSRHQFWDFWKVFFPGCSPPPLPKCHGLLTPLRTNPLKAKVGWEFNCNRVRIGTDQPLKRRNRLQLLSLQIRAHLQRQVMNNSGRSSFLMPM